MNEVRLAVQRAIDKLINRFGTHSEVVEELRAALRLMDQQAGSAAAPAVAEPAPKEQKAGTPGSKPRKGRSVTHGR